MKIRRLLTAEFKAKVALGALRGERTIAEPSSEALTPPEPDYSMEAAGHRQLAKVLDDKASYAQVS